MSDSIVISRDEYDSLRSKAELFDHFIETEELNTTELKNIKTALKGPFLGKNEFLKKRKHLG
jgi:hypothetical protein